MEGQKLQQERLPMLPLRGRLVFPNTVVYLDINRVKSVVALKTALDGDKRLFVVGQRDFSEENPDVSTLYTMGTIVTVRHVVQMPDDVIRVLVQGVARAWMTDLEDTGELLYANTVPVEVRPASDPVEATAYMRSARKNYLQLARLRDGVSNEMRQLLARERRPGVMADVIATNALHDFDELQAILETTDEQERIQRVAHRIAGELDIARLQTKVDKQVNDRLERSNREYYIHEQIRVLEEELGEDDGENDIALYQKQLAKSKISGEARDRVEKEIRRLKRYGVGVPDASVSQNYIETLLELPWGIYDPESIRVSQARQVLESDHYGLKDVKKRILEYIAVHSLRQDMHGPILCLVGAPGVGKTSIARSVARALNRHFCQMSVGGLHDEAEIRGHRRTYMGAIPGRIISAIKQCGVMNPVFLFDELDKMTHDFRGDPASALLEALDPEQNAAFRDHYLEAPFDLSRVMFIATANKAEDIPAALMDRMEIIEVPSYTLEEKVQIAKRHLWKKQLAENGLTSAQLKITERTFSTIIESYTQETGVRELERKLGALCRKVAVEWLDTPEAERKCTTITPTNVTTYLGAPKYIRTKPGAAPEVGVVNGLAWTSVGGVTMPIEVMVMPGEGHLTCTGSLGDVMKESITIAWSYVRAQMGAWHVDADFHKKHDLHVHVPEGATPKDGPSAGVAIACAILSAVTGIPARQDVAMTGELTLRGKVMPIGGVKEKVLAAYRVGIRTVLLPRENNNDLERLPSEIRETMDIRLLSDAGEAIRTVLVEPDHSTEWMNETMAVVV